MVNLLILKNVTLNHAQVIHINRHAACSYIHSITITRFVCTKLYLINLVDCEWDEWTIGGCTVTCGGGLMTKTRKALVNETNGGNPCAGEPTITESCNIDCCPGK